MTSVRVVRLNVSIHKSLDIILRSDDLDFKFII